MSRTRREMMKGNQRFKAPNCRGGCVSRKFSGARCLRRGGPLIGTAVGRSQTVDVHRKAACRSSRRSLGERNFNFFEMSAFKILRKKKPIKSTVDNDMNILADDRISGTRDFTNQFVLFPARSGRENRGEEPASRISREQLDAFSNAESDNARSALDEVEHGHRNNSGCSAISKARRRRKWRSSRHEPRAGLSQR